MQGRCAFNRGAESAGAQSWACLPGRELVKARDAAARVAPGDLGVDVIKRDLGAAAGKGDRRAGRVVDVQAHVAVRGPVVTRRAEGGNALRAHLSRR